VKCFGTCEKLNQDERTRLAVRRTVEHPEGQMGVERNFKEGEEYAK